MMHINFSISNLENTDQIYKKKYHLQISMLALYRVPCLSVTLVGSFESTTLFLKVGVNFADAHCICTSRIHFFIPGLICFFNNQPSTGNTRNLVSGTQSIVTGRSTGKRWRVNSNDQANERKDYASRNNLMKRKIRDLQYLKRWEYDNLANFNAMYYVIAPILNRGAD